jgi:hypothetical protein
VRSGRPRNKVTTFWPSFYGFGCRLSYDKSISFCDLGLLFFDTIVIPTRYSEEYEEKRQSNGQ